MRTRVTKRCVKCRGPIDDPQLADDHDERCASCADALPFGLERPDQILEPFCACGRVVSRCDRSRKACRR